MRQRREDTTITLRLTAKDAATIQEMICGMNCPSVKKTGEGWTHSSICKVFSAAINTSAAESDLLAALIALRELQLGTFDDLPDDEWEQHRNNVIRNATTAVAKARGKQEPPHVFVPDSKESQ